MKERDQKKIYHLRMMISPTCVGYEVVAASVAPSARSLASFPFPGKH